eukprot:GDKJ01021324.1.p1 GENE.GDKJ01021324.1~~GDKJ01021324.1.p1  ORF type:complete len:1008 (+),score=238.86 GDKJ01021324.1:26-3025(+)
MEFRVGEKVYCRGKSATVKFVGEAAFGSGIWYGIAFDKLHGKNDGAVLGKRYFTCEPNHGMFVRSSLLKRTPDVDKPQKAIASATSAQINRSKSRHEAAFALWNYLDEHDETQSYERNRDLNRAMESEMSKKFGGDKRFTDNSEAAILREKVPDSYNGPRFESNIPTRQECIDLLNWMIEHPDKPIHRRFAWQLLVGAIDLTLRTTPTAVMKYSLPRTEVDNDVHFHVLGDTHGQLNDVLWVFLRYGFPSTKNVYCFNGDIADRGKYAVEIFLLLFAFKLHCPESIIINRGNHESAEMNSIYGFADECLNKYGRLFYDKFQDFFFALPLAILVDQRLLIVHGGLFRNENVTIDQIDRLNRFQPCPEVPTSVEDFIFFDLLWSDPMNDEGIAKSARGVDCITFGPDVTQRFCNRNGIEVVIRSHQVPSTSRGYEVLHGGKCVTVFSASNYCGSSGNLGGMIMFKADLHFEIQEYWAPTMEEIKELTQETRSLSDRVGLNLGIDKDRAKMIERRSSAKVLLTAAERMEIDSLRKVAKLIVEKKQELWWHFWNADEKKTGSIPVTTWRQGCAAVIGDNLPWILLQKQLKLQVSADNTIDYNAFLNRFKVEFKPPHNIKVAAGGADKAKLNRWKSETLQRVYEAILKADLSLRETLLILDRNSDGYVGFLEFQDLLKALKLDLSEPQIRALLRTICSAYTVQTPAAATTAAAAAAAASANKVSKQAQLNKQSFFSLKIHVAHFLARFKVVFRETLIRCNPEDETWIKAALAEIGKLIVTKAKKANEAEKVSLRRRSSFKSIFLLAQFQIYDVDKKGYLLYENFVTCLKTLDLASVRTKLNTPLDDKQLMEIAAAVDITGNGRVNYAEFINAFSVIDSEANAAADEMAGSRANASPEEVFMEICTTLFKHRVPIKRALKHFDPELTGSCKPADLKAALSTLNSVMGKQEAPLTRTQIDEIVELVDTDTDGNFDYEDFLQSFSVIDTDPNSPINNPNAIPTSFSS